MDLWIRSQDKEELVFTRRVYVKDNTIRANVYETIGFTILGEYKNNERALEILDEIQNIIRGKYSVSLNFKDAFSKSFTLKQAEELLKQLAVYDMPKE